MFSCLICDKKFLSAMTRAQHVSEVHMGDEDDMIVTLDEPEVPLLFPGEMVMPLTTEDAMGRLKGTMKNTASKLVLCENCPGCEICANAWDKKAVYDDSGVFKMPTAVKRAAQDSAQAGPSKRAADDYWFCHELLSQDDYWVCEGAKDFDSQDDGWLCAAADALDTNSQEELRQAVNAIAELEPTQSMHDFWAAMDEMARADEGEAESGMSVEQIGGALND